MLDTYLESLQNPNSVYIHEGNIMDTLKSMDMKKFQKIFKDSKNNLSNLKAKFKAIPKLDPSVANNFLKGKVKNYEKYKSETEKLMTKMKLKPKVKEGLSVIGGIIGSIQPKQFIKLKAKTEEEDFDGWEFISSMAQTFGTVVIAFATYKVIAMGAAPIIPNILIIAVGCLVFSLIINMIKEGTD
jgi:hypothetical protein